MLVSIYLLLHNLKINTYFNSLQSVFSLEFIIIFFLFSLLCILVNSNNIHNNFFLLICILFSLVILIVSFGLEPISYFFLIGELSALLLLYILSFSKRVKKFNIFFNFLLVFSPLVFIKEKLNYLSFSCFNYTSTNSFNDFKALALSFFLTPKNFLLIIILVFIYSFIIIFKYRSSLLFTPQNKQLSLLKDNLFIFRKNTIKKWFSL